MRLIDADALKANINTAFWSEIGKIIDSAPTIDAVSVVHGEWIKHKERYEPKDKLQTDLVNDSQVLAKDLVDDEFNPYDEECMRCKHLKLKCEFVSSYCKYEPRDEPQTEREGE